MIYRKTFIVLLCIVSLCVNGCSWFHKRNVANEPRIEAPKVTKRDAVAAAKAFAAQEGLGEEFRIESPSKVAKYLTMGKNKHWVWRVYFAHDSQRMIKFYKRSPIMIEINAVTGEVENWGRR